MVPRPSVSPRLPPVLPRQWHLGGGVGPWADVLRERLRVAVFVFDYRGYGRSQGKPNEAGVIADSHAARVWLSQRANRTPEEVILLGRSLGGGVAVQLAAKCPPPVLILENTFPRLTDVAVRQMWWAPVHLLMRNRYDSLLHIQKYPGALIQAHGERDGLVPIQMGRRLFEQVPGPKKFVAIPDAGHNTPFPPWYLDQVDQFLGMHL